MLYYSQVRHRKVYTEDGVYVGKLQDFIFTFANTELAQITKLHVKSALLKSLVAIPMDDVKLFGDRIILHKKYHTAKLEHNEMYVGKNVVDTQIIDIEGKKVVRVNDALIQISGQKDMYVTGVDIGLLGIMRWIGMENIVRNIFHLFRINIGQHVLSWKSVQLLELSQGKVVLDTHQDKLERFLPEDLADYLELTTIRNAVKTLDLVDKEFASEVIAELQLNFQMALFEELDFKKTVQIIDLMDPDEAVDALLQFTTQKRTKVLQALQTTKRKELQALIDVSKTTVGQYMTSEFLVVKRSDKVQDVLKRIKSETEDFDFLFYVYVVNSKNEMIGAFDVHELLLQKSGTRVEKFMHTNVVVCHLNTPIRTVAKRMITYKLYGLPVLERSRKILGVVLLDDIDEAILEQIG